MLKGLKKRWKSLKNGRPGHRFQDEYDERHGENRNPVTHIAILIAGVIVFASGIFFLPAPGPGTIILVIGAGLLAQESRIAAKALDWAELRVRVVVEWAIGVWKRAPLPGKIAIVLLKLVTAATAVYVAYRMMFAK